MALGAGVSWNISNVGAVAVPLASAYDVSLPTIGFFTTALFATHLAAQLPGGRASDRFGPRRIGFVALAAVVAGNLAALASPEPTLALLARALVGIGSGAGFVAGAAYMRSATPSPVLQGAYGGATMASGGLAIAVVPQLEGVLGWRAAYWSALVVAIAAAVPLALSRFDVRPQAASSVALLADRRLLRLAAMHAATFGLSVVAANWVVTLLERHGHDRGAAGAVGALLLLGGIVTRPLGGLVVLDRRERVRAAVAASLLAMSLGTAALATPLPLPVLAGAAALAGLAAGLPFATVFSEAQELRRDAPAAAVGFVNVSAILTIVAGTPLVGLTFSLPGDGSVGFVAIAALSTAALAALPRGR